MIYFFRCPRCHADLNINWENRQLRYKCPTCGNSFQLPLPQDQPTACVDTHRWPVLMEDQVVAKKGNMCTVPGCRHRAETLDHRIPFSKGGNTSLENLFPMCIEHNQSKGDTDYEFWLAFEGHN